MTQSLPLWAFGDGRTGVPGRFGLIDVRGSPSLNTYTPPNSVEKNEPTSKVVFIRVML